MTRRYSLTFAVLILLAWASSPYHLAAQDLQLEITADRSPVVPGTPVVFSVVVSNTGGSSISETSITHNSQLKTWAFTRRRRTRAKCSVPQRGQRPSAPGATAVRKPILDGIHRTNSPMFALPQRADPSIFLIRSTRRVNMNLNSNHAEMEAL